MADEEQTKSGTEREAFDHTGKIVLVIDDTSDVRMIVVETLKVFGFATLSAEDGVSGIEVANKNLPDLVVCDINMPNMDGFETLTAMRSHEPTSDIPFIFLSGAADKLDMRKGMDSGADDYLTKPFTPKELLAAVNTRLDKKAIEEQRTDEKLKSLRGNITLALPHELRTPLNGIMGLAGLMIEDYQIFTPEEVLENSQLIHESAMRLHRLIENFLVFSQMELMASESKTLGLSPNMPPVAPGVVVPDVTQTVSKRFDRSADLVLDTVSAPVYVPEDDFRKILEELVDNGFKFSKNGDPVLVESFQGDDGYRLVVTDKGRGMTIEQISKIAPHVQFERDVYEQQGAGLGLVIAKRMTEMLGGKFLVESEPGEGTTVTVLFPSQAVAQAA